MKRPGRDFWATAIEDIAGPSVHDGDSTGVTCRILLIVGTRSEGLQVSLLASVTLPDMLRDDDVTQRNRYG